MFLSFIGCQIRHYCWVLLSLWLGRRLLRRPHLGSWEPWLTSAYSWARGRSPIATALVLMARARQFSGQRKNSFFWASRCFSFTVNVYFCEVLIGSISALQGVSRPHFENRESHMAIPSCYQIQDLWFLFWVSVKKLRVLAQPL